jgi:hypothetical protein
VEFRLTCPQMGTDSTPFTRNTLEPDAGLEREMSQDEMEAVGFSVETQYEARGVSIHGSYEARESKGHCIHGGGILSGVNCKSPNKIFNSFISSLSTIKNKLVETPTRELS